MLRAYFQTHLRHMPVVARHRKLFGLAREKLYRLRLGEAAPLYAERLLITPVACTKALHMGPASIASGRIVTDEQAFAVARPLLSLPIISACIAHWSQGMSWEDTGLFEKMNEAIAKYGQADGCRNLGDVVARYRGLDAMFEQVRASGTLFTRQELDPSAFREEGGILVHVGPSGELFFGGNGNHRLAMAIALELPCIPAQLGSIYAVALPHLEQIRQREEKPW